VSGFGSHSTGRVFIRCGGSVLTQSREREGAAVAGGRIFAGPDLDLLTTPEALPAAVYLLVREGYRMPAHAERHLEVSHPRAAPSWNCTGTWSDWPGLLGLSRELRMEAILDEALLLVERVYGLRPLQTVRLEGTAAALDTPYCARRAPSRPSVAGRACEIGCGDVLSPAGGQRGEKSVLHPAAEIAEPAPAHPSGQDVAGDAPGRVSGRWSTQFNAVPEKWAAFP